MDTESKKNFVTELLNNKYTKMTTFCKPECKDDLAKRCDCYFSDFIKMMQE